MKELEEKVMIFFVKKQQERQNLVAEAGDMLMWAYNSLQVLDICGLACWRTGQCDSHNLVFGINLVTTQTGRKNNWEDSFRRRWITNSINEIDIANICVIFGLINLKYGIEVRSYTEVNHFLQFFIFVCISSIKLLEKYFEWILIYISIFSSLEILFLLKKTRGSWVTSIMFKINLSKILNC